MILVTGATGFVGRALLPTLAEAGFELRVLLRPTHRNPRLPRGLPVQVAIARLNDERSLRAALVGVETVVHLIGAEWYGQASNVLAVDAQGTRFLVEAAKDAGVKRLLYVSHLGADRASAYPVLRAKGIAEEFIRQSGLSYTIFRTAVLFGEEDVFFNILAAVLKLMPLLFLMPGDGRTNLQPLWVNDLVTCLQWTLSDNMAVNQTLALGGPEFITLAQTVDILMEVLKLRRSIVPIRPVYLRGLTWFIEQVLPRSPLTSHWLDYLAISRTCELISVTRHFGLKPKRFSPPNLGYLRTKNWPGEMGRLIFS